MSTWHVILLGLLEGLTEFLAVFAPLRVVGGTGAPVRPLAVVGA